MIPDTLVRILAVAALGLAAACSAGRAAPPPSVADGASADTAVVVPPFPYAMAWTARADVAVRTEAGETRIPNLFTRLNVLAVDTPGILVRCLYCIPAVDGWVARDDLVYEPLAPAAAAREGLAPLALAVRQAAEGRDEAALLPVMSRDFTFGFEGGGGGADAWIRWRWRGFRALDNLPPLLDRGLVTRDSVVWHAPPAFVTDPEYHGLRAGFRRAADGSWQWVYLVGRD